jgi:hypothetical protein
VRRPRIIRLPVTPGNRGRETLGRLERLGLLSGAALLSGGSRGTCNIDTAIEGVTELRAESYVFMDVD